MSRHLPIFCFIVLCLSSHTLQGQMIRGRITDTKGEPVIYATLFVRELKQGTSTNEEGHYELKLPEGTYTCIFRSVGYETVTQEVIIDREVITLDITMPEKAYEIKEVIISNTREDPAYNIMRRAIAMAPYYMHQVSEYKAEVYMKGSLKIDKISRIVKRLAKEELKDIKEGNTYVEESFNEVEFTAPNKYRQKVVKKTGNIPNSDNINILQMVTISTYDPEAVLPYISPLSQGAFSYYRFSYEGYIEEGDRMINKIRIKPIRKSKQLFSGYIYIADNFWYVHSVDVSGEFVAGGDFRLRINFGEVSDNIWLPVSHRVDFSGSILGNKGDFLYLSSVKYNHIAENTSIRKPDILQSTKKQQQAQQQEAPLPELSLPVPADKNKRKVEELLAQEDLSNREAYKLARMMEKEAANVKKDKKSLDLTETMSNDYKVEIDSTANVRDTSFWKEKRPVPLMPNEVKGYKEAGVNMDLQRRTTKDSAANRKPQGTASKILLGTRIKLGESGGRIEYRGLIPSKLGFNTVDGFFIGQKLTYRQDFKRDSGTNRLSVTPEVVWAFNRKALMFDVKSDFSYAPLRRGNASLAFGKTSSDFNGQHGIYPLENTIASLFFRRNYQKLYDNSFIKAENTIDIANGLQAYVNLQYAHRKILENHSDFSFFYNDSRDYSSNVPRNPEWEEPPYTDHRTTSFTVNLSYTPRFYYRIDRNNRKRMVRSDFPTFFASWQKGVKNLFDSDSDYDYISAGIRQSLETGIMQKFQYLVRGGMFVNDHNVFFADYRHFKSLEIPLTMGTIENFTFNLLEYYRYSTRDKFLEAHLYFSTPFLALKYLPFFSNRLWSEGLQLNYLYTPELNHYCEFGYSIGLLWRAGVFVGFEDFKYRSVGFRLSLPVSLFIN